MVREFLFLLRRLSLVAVLATTAFAGLGIARPHLVQASDDDDWGEDDDSGGGDDGGYDDEGDDAGDGEGDEYYDDEDEGGSEEDYQQPPRWAGGLYTKETWPQSFVERNLLMIRGMAQLHGGLDIDISDRTAFDVWRGVLGVRYGVRDYFELDAGARFVLTGELTPDQLALGDRNATVFMGMESAIAYELVDFRLTTELLYSALGEGDFDFNIAFGFPFRYRFNDKIAIYALERLMTIETNGSKPNFTLGLSAAFQAARPLAVLLGATVNVEDFNFKDNAVVIPAYLGVLFAPRNDVDLGLQFTFLNLKPIQPEDPDAEEIKFYDQRSLQIYAQLRL